MPCYNAERTLSEALDSILTQADVFCEIVVIDDGSTDGSITVAKKYLPHIRLISGPNRGASNARNVGITATTAPWLVFLDADDWLEPGTLRERIGIGSRAKSDVVITDWLEVLDDGSGCLQSGAHRAVDWNLLQHNAEVATATEVWATTAAILYSRRIVESIGGFRSDLSIIQDARFLFDAAFHGGRFIRADHIGAKYRILPGSLSRSNPTGFWLDVLRNGRQIETAWRRRGQLPEENTKALVNIYDSAARMLFRLKNPAYFDAIRELERFQMPQSRHSQVSSLLARRLGLGVARRILGLIGKA